MGALSVAGQEPVGRPLLIARPLVPCPPWPDKMPVDKRDENVFQILVVTVAEPTPTEEGALARSQATRRRRVLDAALRLAAEGGFDGVQMRDVAAAADVALGTVYRYFSSKERLLLEAMAEQQADLRRYLEIHPPQEQTAAARVVAVLRQREPVAARASGRHLHDGELDRFRATRERRHRAACHRDHDRDHHQRDSRTGTTCRDRT